VVLFSSLKISHYWCIILVAAIVKVTWRVTFTVKKNINGKNYLAELNNIVQFISIFFNIQKWNIYIY